jgi:hypothetical protein
LPLPLPSKRLSGLIEMVMPFRSLKEGKSGIVRSGVGGVGQVPTREEKGGGGAGAMAARRVRLWVG